MSNIRFFSNSIITLDHKENEIVASPKNTRDEPSLVFTVPEHTVGTNNLMIFIDGKLCIRTRDYQDINSYEVEFANPINVNQDFVAVLIKTSKDLSSGGGECSCPEWESF